MSTSVTTKQVSSPYAIYENETDIATIPYEVLRVASQFVYKDYTKQLLMGIHLKVENNEITVASTDGHRLFYFKFPNNELGFKLNKNITIPGSIFKSQVKQATKVIVRDNLITFMNEEILLSSLPYSLSSIKKCQTQLQQNKFQVHTLFMRMKLKLLAYLMKF